MLARFSTLQHSSGSPPYAPPRHKRIRVLCVITRMNVGGPAHQVGLLSGRLDPNRYETLLVCGEVGPGEASFEYIAEKYGVTLEKVQTLGPAIRPFADLRALVRIVRIVRRFRPDVVHTHTAKAGMVGRLAALLAPRPRPLVLHTYHGHVLEGYFGPLKSRLYGSFERVLSVVTDCLIGVSQATVDDLVRLSVAPSEKFRVIPLGLDLDRFVAADGLARKRFRNEVVVQDGEVLFAYVGRLVPIKRLDLMLRAFARARGAGTSVRLVVVGDGVLRESLENLAGALGLKEYVNFLGYRSDVEMISAGCDAAILSSDNEGTPVSLIEAAAAGRPAVATAVGGVPDVVVVDTGILVPPGDEVALADAMIRMAKNSLLREALGRRARTHVLGRFLSDRLLRDVDALYRELLADRGHATRSGCR